MKHNTYFPVHCVVTFGFEKPATEHTQYESIETSKNHSKNDGISAANMFTEKDL